MVRQGDYEVRLINAETTLPFKEHIHKADGKVYVEVEPDVDYYIQVTRFTGMKHVLVTADVDKVNIGYCSHLQENHDVSLRLGCRNGSGDITAFRFHKTMIELPNEDDKDTKDKDKNVRKTWTGTIKVKFYVAVPNPLAGIGSFGSGNSWHKGEVGATLGITPLNQKKGVYSDEGMVQLQQNVKWVNDYIYGEMLAEIDFMYCSTVGLIVFGLLPSPEQILVSDQMEDDRVNRRKRAKMEKVTLDLTEDDD